MWRSGAVASFGPYSTPQKEKSVNQSGTPLSRGGHREGGSPNRNLEEEGRGMSYKLNYPRPVSVAARGQKRTLQLVTHIPNESHRLGAPITLPFAFIRTNLCKLTFPVTRGASTQSAPAKSTNLVYRGSIFVPLTCCPHRSLCDVYRKGWRRGQPSP